MNQDSGAQGFPQVIIKGHPPKETHVLKTVIRDLVVRLRKQPLDLARLESIIITKDYEGELATFQTVSGNPLVYTNEEYARGHGQVVSQVRDGELSMTVLLDDVLCRKLLSAQEDSVRFAIHMLHHELCHVHDINHKSRCLSKYWLNYRVHGLDAHLLPIAMGIWDEYFACRYSAGTADTTSVSNYVSSLADAVRRTRNLVKETIREYRTDLDIGRLMEVALRHGGFLLKTAAYVHGYLAGLGQSMKALSPQMNEILQNSYFKSIWEQMGNDLQKMHDSYPNWDSLEIFDGLKRLVNEFFVGSGLEFEEMPDGQVFLHVPFTASSA